MDLRRWAFLLALGIVKYPNKDRYAATSPKKVLNCVPGYPEGLQKGSKKGLGRRVSERANGAMRVGKNSAGARLDP